MVDTTHSVLLSKIPAVVSNALVVEYGKMSSHYILQEWDDLEVDAGRFVEAVLRVLEWYSTSSYTPIDGKSKPDRSKTLNTARQNTALAPSLRLQIPMLCELILDFRNNRNAAHLGSINPAKIDGVTVAQQCAWILGELIRLDASVPVSEIQEALDELADRPASLIYELDGHPIVLSTGLNFKQIAIVQLYHKKQPVQEKELFKWSGHTHITRWRSDVLNKLQKDKQVYTKDGFVHILPPGIKTAESIISRSEAM